ncbi:SpoIID/LytB domain-containing protein [Leptolyngbya sp. PCC 6406]|uniref:SpoIID/LytB domain-containing protein n=1 Tax=Leptolyngbya sp. PCC 6406 TaxID=1173264 RepID=UPI00031E3827|nr:SpoIID/LytB domain-containing protein [Leptolyngbya sp. PCC 6406]
MPELLSTPGIGQPTMTFQQELDRIQRLCFRRHLQLRWSETGPTWLSRLVLASGAVLTGILALWLIPLPGVRGAVEPLAFDGKLNHGFFLLRQSFIGLYTFQERQGLPVAAAPEDQQDTASAPAPEEANAAASAAQSTPEVMVIDDALEMRVAIARRASTLNVGTSTQGWLVDTGGQQRCDISPETSLIAQPSGSGLTFSGCQLPGAVWLEAIHGGYVFVEGSWYKGRVLLLNQGGQLLAVNFVFLRDYLSSVVGSEMYPHWPLEALKAQAVAARSYALTHHVRPASDHFDLDNTQRYQAYKGIAVETNTTQAAVAATAGEFISYQGGIVESLYAASDQIVQEAHGGQGMSQSGARDHANQGYSYSQILGTYYPGTSLSRLVVQ